MTGLIASDSVNVDKAVDIGKSQVTIFESSLPQGFYGGISNKVVTMNTSKKSIKAGDKDIFDASLTYSRVLGLQQSRDIDLKDVLEHELSPVPTFMFQ